MKRFIIALAALTLLPVLAYGQSADDTHTCPGVVTSPTTTITGGNLQSGEGQDYTSNGIYDATGAATIVRDRDELAYPYNFRTNDACWKGGAFQASDSRSESWADSKHNDLSGAGNPTSIFVIPVSAGNFVFDGIRIDNAHDAVKISRKNGAGEGTFEFRNNWVTYNRDDTIENDWNTGAIIDDNLIDGTYTFYSSRSENPVPSNNHVVITNNLIRMQDLPIPYGHGGQLNSEGWGLLFKEDGTSVTWDLHDNIIRMDSCPSSQKSLNVCSQSAKMGFYPGSNWPTNKSSHLQNCSNNTIVWLGDGDGDGDFTDNDFPGDIPNDPSCVTVTRDVSVWNTAKQNWINNHPNVKHLAGDPAVASPTPISIDEARVFDLNTGAYLDLGGGRTALQSGDTVDISGAAAYGIQAFASGTPLSVEFAHNSGAYSLTEEREPWSDGLDASWPRDTALAITITPYPQDALGGTAGTALSLTNVTFTEGVTPPTAVEASFSYSCTDLSCTFTDASTGSLTSHMWDFGDGETDNATASPSHEFDFATKYTVKLTVSDGTISDSAQAVIDLALSDTIPPTLSIGEPTASAGGKSFARVNEDVPIILNVNDNVKVGRVVVEVDGDVVDILRDDSWTTVWSPDTVGEANMKIKALDAAGNETEVRRRFIVRR